MSNTRLLVTYSFILLAGVLAGFFIYVGFYDFISSGSSFFERLDLSRSQILTFDGLLIMIYMTFIVFLLWNAFRMKIKNAVIISILIFVFSLMELYFQSFLQVNV